jgi:hypothetical protein
MSRPTLVKADAEPAPSPECPFTSEQAEWLADLLKRRDEVERGQERAFWEEVRSGLLLLAGAIERRYLRKKVPRP